MCLPGSSAPFASRERKPAQNLPTSYFPRKISGGGIIPIPIPIPVP